MITSYLSDDTIRELKDTLSRLGLATGQTRTMLLAHIHRGFAAALPVRESPLDQLWSDLVEMNAVACLEDGQVPLEQWLENAAGMLKSRGLREQQRFQQVLDQVRHGAEVAIEEAQAPPGPPVAVPAPAATVEGEFAYDVFISYSYSDRDWVVKTLLPRLEAGGLKACIDYRDFRPGSASDAEMERAVLVSRKTLMVLTPAYVASEWTEFEASMAIALDPAAREHRLIPLRKEKCDIPLRLRRLTYVDFVDPVDEDISWRQLLTALRATTGTPRVRGTESETQ